jgi:hypothetical protein
MYKYIWLVPLLPLIGAAINGLLGRKFRFPEHLVGGIAIGSVALAFLISLGAVYSYGFGGTLEFGKPYLTSEDGFSFEWIPGGAVSINQGAAARAGIESERQAQEKLGATPEQRSVTAATEAPRRTTQCRMELPTRSTLVNFHVACYWGGPVHLSLCNWLHARRSRVLQVLCLHGHVHVCNACARDGL